MKTPILTTIFGVLFVALFIQAQTNVTVRERFINTIANSDLKAASLRITVNDFSLDRVLTLNVELLNTNATDRIIDRRLVKLGPAAVRAWVNATTNDEWLEWFVLQKVSLNRR